MSVAVQEHDHPGAASRDGRERLAVVAAVLATLGVIAGPGVVAALGLVGDLAPVVEETRLSDNARRVLDELPDAYTAGGVVVVPAATDPHVVWIGPVAGRSVHGRIVDLGVRGLVPFGTLPTRGTTPAWRSAVEPADQVFSDVGPLYFACTPRLSGDGCSGEVLMQHAGRWHALGDGAGAPDQGSVTRISVQASGGEAGLWLGWSPPGTTSVWATIVSHHGVRELPAHTEATGAGPSSLAWWIRSLEPVSAVSFQDARGTELARLRVGD